MNRRAVVVMGVTGSGKSTLGRALAQALGWQFLEGDSLHPAANIAKMSAGQALDDEDRSPFLDNIARAIADSRAAGIVVSCSALKRSYRDRLRQGDPQILFVLPILTKAALQARLSGRSGHFMPASLLDSQLAILEMPQSDELSIQVQGETTTAQQVRQSIAAAQARGIVPSLRIQDVDPQGEVALALLREAAVDVRPLYSDDSTAALPMPQNLPLGPRDIYIVAWLGEVPVGCGAIRELNQTSAEVRRMYVRRDYRRIHVGRRILRHLENEATRLGYRRLLLETGNRQAAAMALYEAAGFHRVQPFGQYVDDPTSVCYERNLQAEETMNAKVAVFGTLRFPPERVDEVLPHLRQLIDATYKSDGCIAYDAALDPFDKGLIRFSELWPDQESLSRHLQAPHIAPWRAATRHCALLARQFVAFDVSGSKAI